MSQIKAKEKNIFSERDKNKTAPLIVNKKNKKKKHGAKEKKAKKKGGGKNTRGKTVSFVASSVFA